MTRGAGRCSTGPRSADIPAISRTLGDVGRPGKSAFRRRRRCGDPPSTEAVEAEDDEAAAGGRPHGGRPDDDESREDVPKTLPPRPPPARARSRGAAVNYADPHFGIIVSELRVLALLGLVLREA